jgi:ribonuclease P protein subunit POP4
MITPRNIVRHELIGLRVRITGSKNRESIGASGRVVDESRNTFTVEVKGNGGKEKRFVKDQCVFSFFLPLSRKWVRVDGNVLVARPEDRIKKKVGRW